MAATPTTTNIAPTRISSRPWRRRRSRQRKGAIPFTEQRIDYILSTGANWSGPIGNFRLVVKGDPSNLVSFCGEGVKKIDPTQFELRKSDYVPDGDLNVLILSKPPA